MTRLVCWLIGHQRVPVKPRERFELAMTALRLVADGFRVDMSHSFNARCARCHRFVP